MFSIRVVLGVAVTVGMSVLAVGGCSSARMDDFTDQADMVLWYTKPATNRTEALPLGNGRLGAIVFGGVSEELLHLSEETLWANGPYDYDREGYHEKALPAIWQMLEQDRFLEAQAMTDKELFASHYRRRQEIMGNLLLKFADHELPEGYRRELDMDTAVTKVSYTSQGARFTREAFVSARDQVLAMRLTCDKPGQLSFDAEMTRGMNADVDSAPDRPDLLIMRGTGDPPEVGLKFEVHLRIIPEGGSVTVDQSVLRVEGADSAVLILAAATNFKKGTVDGEDPTQVCARQIQSASQRPFDQMLADHIADHQSYFRRASLFLGSTPEVQRGLPTDERLELIRSDNVRDPELEAQVFQLGRYLLICSSRPGTQPATLHGIWPQLEGADGHNCAYHLNINIAENYWPAEVTNLADCHEPFIDLMKDMLPNAHRTARDVYGCNGVVCGHNVDAWFSTGPLGQSRWAGQWVGGYGWAAQDVWEHYAFSGDKEYLRNRAWPILKSVAEFFLDYNRADSATGRVYIGPSGSPENGFLVDGERITVDYGISMDQEIAHETFRHCLQAAEALGIEDDFTRKVEAILPKLALPGIGADGRLLEWREERDEEDPRHRHHSHVYGLHPGDRITMEGNPVEAEAARKSILFRLSGEKFEYGPTRLDWQHGWHLNLWARLRDTELYERTFQDFLTKYTEPNLNSRWSKRPFVMDANGAFTAGVAEALLQSHTDEIHLLPCLPALWPEGGFTGFRARGGVTISASWKNNSVTAELLANNDGAFKIRFGDTVRTVQLKKDSPLRITIDNPS